MDTIQQNIAIMWRCVFKKVCHDVLGTLKSFYFEMLFGWPCDSWKKSQTDRRKLTCDQKNLLNFQLRWAIKGRVKKK